MQSRIFISYSKEEPALASDLAGFLADQGCAVWWDRNLTSGEVFREVIDRELDAADAVVVIWTEGAARSKWVIAEADHAARQDKLITVRSRNFDPWRIPKPFNAYQADILDDRASILDAIRRVASQGARPETEPAVVSKPRSQSKKSRAPFLRLFLLTVILAAGAILWLSLFPVPSIPIELQATSNALAFGVADEEAVFDPFLADTVTVIGPGKVDVDGTVKTFQSSYTVSRTGDAPPFTVQGLKLKRGEMLRFTAKAGTEKAFEVTLPPADGASLTLFAQGPLSIAADARSASIQSAAPQTFEFSFPGEAAFSVKLGEKEWTSGASFAAEKISFLGVAEKQGVPTAFSALKGGLIRFTDIETGDGKNKEISLESGQRVVLTPKQAGQVRTLKLSDTGIGLVYDGEASGLSIGNGKASMIDRMPSYLTYYRWLGLLLSVSAGVALLLLVYLQLLQYKMKNT